MVMAGVAIGCMVLTGAMIVGDSIKSSLERSAELRLGKTEYLFSANDRYFRASLADDLRKDLDLTIAPLLQLSGSAAAQGGEYRMNGLQVVAMDVNFGPLIPGMEETGPPPPNGAYISENLAARLQVQTGDAFVLRVEKASLVPKNAPFVSDEDNYVSLRLIVEKILGDEGRFNLRTSQTAPYNVFVSLGFLAEKMELEDRANRLLFSGNDQINEDPINAAIRKYWTHQDAGLGVYTVNEGADLEVRSGRVFMDEVVVEAVKGAYPEAREVLTYMVNAFQKGDSLTPYSFISAGPFGKEKNLLGADMIINDWMAEDLGASVGDSIEIAFYVIGPLRKLQEEKEQFIIRQIVPMEGIYGEKDLMPDLPGLSDAGNCRDWETGVPVELARIRDKDEDYWKEHKGTPKAFIGYEKGRKLWQNRFGTSTAVRMPARNLTKETIEQKLSETVAPDMLGFSLRPVKQEGLTAANSGVDFSQLFMGLSFFLLVAGLVLMALLFGLHLERRKAEIGTLKALGWSARLIRKLFLLEGLFIAVPGALAGGLLAVLYNKLVFKALNTVWYDIVLTSVLQEDVQAGTLVTGVLIALVLSYLVIGYNVFKKLKTEATTLQRNIRPVVFKKRKMLLYGGWVSGLLVVAITLYGTVLSRTLDAGLFFLAGGLLLISGLLVIAYRLGGRTIATAGQFSTGTLIHRNLFRNYGRSLRIVVLFSLGTFVVISTGLNKKDMHSAAHLPSSGTGGYGFYMETTLPVLHDLNNPEYRANLGTGTDMEFVQIRKSEGDDASCLNLNRVTAPRILGVPSGQLKERFSFVQSTEDLDPNDPWGSLKKPLTGGVVPAIADQTVIQWGLGLAVGDTLVYLDEAGKEMKLKLIGGLANSIFQGNILIDEDLFLEHFPSSSGTHVFLVGGVEDRETAAAELARAFRNEGTEIAPTADRLAAFNQVENTYLSIFMLLGGLAMIIGTIGLGIVLARNILDRTQEIGLLQAVGYRKKDVMKIIIREHMVLLALGALLGAAAAFMAILPSLLSEFVTASWQTALVIIGLVLGNGYLWVVAVTRGVLRGR